MSTNSDIDSVIRKIDSKNSNKNETEKLQIRTTRDLLQESANIGELKRYNMMLQNISLSENVTKYIKNRNIS